MMFKKPLYVCAAYLLLSFKSLCAVPWWLKCCFGWLLLTAPGGSERTTIAPQFKDRTDLFVMGEAAVEWRRDFCGENITPHDNCALFEEIRGKIELGREPKEGVDYPIAVSGAAYAYAQYQNAIKRNTNMLSGTNYAMLTNVLLRVMLSEFDSVSGYDYRLLESLELIASDSACQGIVFDTYQLDRIVEVIRKQLDEDDSYETPWDAIARIVLSNVKTGANKQLFDRWKIRFGSAFDTMR